MLVNENRLNLADQRARQYLARQMENHFFGPARTWPRATCRPASRPDRADGRTGRVAAGRHAAQPALRRHLSLRTAGSNRPAMSSCAAAACPAWAGQPQWRILETGFGLGLNFLAAWQAWSRTRSALACCTTSPSKPGRSTAEDLLRSAAAYPNSRRWRRHWPRNGTACCRASIAWYSRGHVLLTLHVRDVRDVLREQPFRADSISWTASIRGATAMWDLHTLKAVAPALPARHAASPTYRGGRSAARPGPVRLRRGQAEGWRPSGMPEGRVRPAWEPKAPPAGERCHAGPLHRGRRGAGRRRGGCQPGAARLAGHRARRRGHPCRRRFRPAGGPAGAAPSRPTTTCCRDCRVRRAPDPATGRTCCAKANGSAAGRWKSATGPSSGMRRPRGSSPRRWCAPGWPSPASNGAATLAWRVLSDTRKAGRCGTGKARKSLARSWWSWRQRTPAARCWAMVLR